MIWPGLGRHVGGESLVGGRRREQRQGQHEDPVDQPEEPVVSDEERDRGDPLEAGRDKRRRSRGDPDAPAVGCDDDLGPDRDPALRHGAS